MTLKSLLLGATAASSLALMAQTAQAERGSDGHVNVIYWQAPSIMTPYLSGGTKEVEAASLVLEPLARYNEKGERVPYLATEIPRSRMAACPRISRRSPGPSSPTCNGPTAHPSPQRM